MYSSSIASTQRHSASPAPGAARDDPRSDMPDGDHPTAQVQHIRHQGMRLETVLIVENEENNRRLVEQILGFAGYSYLSASNGLEALDILSNERVDVVLIDLAMPILDGYRTTELIRQRPECAALPIVAVTAHAMSEDRELALRAGCTEYLAKPFRPNELVTIVDRMLSEVYR
jgi:CheY-like chemotaxis protein